MGVRRSPGRRNGPKLVKSQKTCYFWRILRPLKKHCYIFRARFPPEAPAAPQISSRGACGAPDSLLRRLRFAPAAPPNFLLDRLIFLLGDPATRQTKKLYTRTWREFTLRRRCLFTNNLKINKIQKGKRHVRANPGNKCVVG